MKTLLRVSLLLLLGLGFTITAMADVAATIAKVRAHLGGEAAAPGEVLLLRLQRDVSVQLVVRINELAAGT